MVFDGVKVKEERTPFLLAPQSGKPNLRFATTFFFLLLLYFGFARKRENCLAIRIKQVLGPGQLLLSAANG